MEGDVARRTSSTPDLGDGKFRCMITVFINPAARRAAGAHAEELGDRDHQPSRGNTIASTTNTRVIVDELMPVLTKQYNISPDPDMHAIAGASSGHSGVHGGLGTPNQFTNLQRRRQLRESARAPRLPRESPRK